MDDPLPVSHGGCHCGAIRYEVRGNLRDVIHCHCEMCRRLHGAFASHSKALKTQVSITKDDGLAWYKTSDIARRGFCKLCGAPLFWEPFQQPGLGISAGSLDDPNALKTLGHIFVGEKADFYEIGDGYPQFETSSEGVLPGDYKDGSGS